ncbi:hypothetical protein [Methylobacterium fujisawaense]|jgi:hypothetical protein
MLQSQTERRTWTAENREILVRWWMWEPSVVVIALLLGRSTSAVQTMASRIGLPKRDIEPETHRRRWTDQEIAEYDLEKERLRRADGRTPLVDLSKALRKSLDTVAIQFLQDVGTAENFLRSAWLPEPPPLDERRQERRLDCAAPVDKRKLPAMRKCLSCERGFWSEGAHIRRCPNCKAEDEGW